MQLLFKIFLLKQQNQCLVRVVILGVLQIFHGLWCEHNLLINTSDNVPDKPIYLLDPIKIISMLRLIINYIYNYK